MTKPLSDTQRVILANAATRVDGHIFPVPKTLNKNSGAVSLSLRPLLASGLVSEIPAGKSDTTWGQTEEGSPTTLGITGLGLQVIGVQAGSDEPTAIATLSMSSNNGPSPSSKLGILVASLSTTEGATLDQLVAATGWQKHSVRGAISGALKVKHKLIVLSEVIEGKGRVYRIPSQAAVNPSTDAVSKVGDQGTMQP